MSSPFIAQFTGESSGVIAGKDTIAAYWRTALQKLPDLRFDLLGVFIGAASIIIHYRTSFGKPLDFRHGSHLRCSCLNFFIPKPSSILTPLSPDELYLSTEIPM